MGKKLALLIDTENVKADYIDVIIQELKQYGDITVQRMYGDFTNPQIKDWADRGLEYAIVPIHQLRYSQNKNASDIMLVIDAMDILFQGNVDIFCIVSSDSDFTRLASRLREGGKKVIGLGKSNASKTFIKACDEYKFLDLISEDEIEEVDESSDDSAITPLSQIKSALNYMLQQAECKGDLLHLGSTKSQLQREFADFDERNYGFSSFQKFIEEETRFIVVKDGSTAYISRKNQEKKQDIQDEVNKYILSRLSKPRELSKLGNDVVQKYPKFKYKDLGYSKISKYIQKVPGVEIVVVNNKKCVKKV